MRTCSSGTTFGPLPPQCLGPGGDPEDGLVVGGPPYRWCSYLADRPARAWSLAGRALGRDASLIEPTYRRLAG